MAVHVVEKPDCKTKRRLRLTDMLTAVCLKSSRHGVTRHPRTGVRGLLLHHENASVHTAAVTLDFLAASNVQHTHPPTIFTHT